MMKTTIEDLLHKSPAGGHRTESGLEKRLGRTTGWTTLLAIVTAGATVFAAYGGVIDAYLASLHFARQLSGYPSSIWIRVWNSPYTRAIGTAMIILSFIAFSIWIGSARKTAKAVGVRLKYDPYLEKSNYYNMYLNAISSAVKDVHKVQDLFLSCNEAVAEAKDYTSWTAKAIVSTWTVLYVAATVVSVVIGALLFRRTVRPDNIYSSLVLQAVLLLLWVPANALAVYVAFHVVGRLETLRSKARASSDP